MNIMTMTVSFNNTLRARKHIKYHRKLILFGTK